YQLLALIFGTLLSSQGTDASFVLTLSGFPPGASFVSDSIRLFHVRFPVEAGFAFAFQGAAFAFSLFGESDSTSGFSRLRPRTVLPKGTRKGGE
ncbi:hypothetical protein OS965_34430, partial [Streptomyces sp. H27-G5]|uniref:hypothetical protein n=1 Tax=Streptomyces sp. H27-G5 TaxID=2996698 RepID=UPI002271F812